MYLRSIVFYEFILKIVPLFHKAFMIIILKSANYFSMRNSTAQVNLTFVSSKGEK